MAHTITIKQILEIPNFFDSNYVEVQTVNGFYRVVKVNKTPHGIELLTAVMPYPCDYDTQVYYTPFS